RSRMTRRKSIVVECAMSVPFRCPLVDEVTLERWRSALENSEVEKRVEPLRKLLPRLGGPDPAPDNRDELGLDLLVGLGTAELDDQPCRGVELVDLRVCGRVDEAPPPFRQAPENGFRAGPQERVAVGHEDP